MRRAWLVSLLLLACCSETRPNEVLIKGGTFTPGNDRSYPEEARGAPVTVGSFMMDATEVTNAAFAAFVKATGYVTVAEKGFANDSRVPKEQQQPGARPGTRLALHARRQLAASRGTGQFHRRQRG